MQSYRLQEEYNEEEQTATVHLEYISDLIKPAFVEINIKRNKVRLIFIRCTRGT